jgi:hypothetical protein
MLAPVVRSWSTLLALNCSTPFPTMTRLEIDVLLMRYR